jgi:hypothetical protein
MNKQIGMLLMAVSVTLSSCFDAHPNSGKGKDLPFFEKLPAAKLSLPAPEKPPFYISGIYVLTSQGDFCTTWDTLWVSKRAKEVNSYTIRRKTVFQRNVGERLFPAEASKESWTGSYNAAAEKMEAVAEAQAFQVCTERNGVELDGNFYQKIE